MESKTAGESHRSPKTQSSQQRVRSVYAGKQQQQLITKRGPQKPAPTSINMRTVGLPQNKKWQVIKQICSLENLSAGDAFLKSASLRRVNDSCNSPQEITITPQKSVQNNINCQNPLLSGSTFAMYSRTLQTNSGDQGSARDSVTHGINNILHTKFEGRSRLAGGHKQRKQIDLTQAVLQIHSPSQLIASIKPNQNFNQLLLSNENLLTANHNQTIGQSHSSRHQLRRQANSSTLSDKSGDNNAILKPMIHFALPIHPDGETENILQTSRQHLTDFTEETQQSNRLQEPLTLKNQRSSKVATKLLMSDKNTLRLNETEQSMVSSEQRQYTTTPNRFDSINRNLRHVKVSAPKQTMTQLVFEEQKGGQNFNSTLRKNTLLRSNMVDEGTSPIQSEMKNIKSPERGLGLARRYPTNVDVASVYQPDEAMGIELADPEKQMQANNKKKIQRQTDSKRNGQQLQRSGILQRSHKPSVIQVKFVEDVRTFPNARPDSVKSPKVKSNPRLVAETKKIKNSPITSSSQRPRPQPILSPSNMLRDQFKPILQQNVDHSPLNSTSLKCSRKSINSPASAQDRTVLLPPSEKGVLVCTEARQSPVSPEPQLSCKLLPIETMEKGPPPMVRTMRSSVAGSSSAVGIISASKSSKNSTTIQNFKQIKQRQIILEAPVNNMTQNMLFKQNYQKQHARAAEKMTLHSRTKQATVQQAMRRYDQQSQTQMSPEASKQPSPLGVANQMQHQQIKYVGECELREPSGGNNLSESISYINFFQQNKRSAQDDNKNSSANSSRHSNSCSLTESKLRLLQLADNNEQQRLYSLNSPGTKDKLSAIEAAEPLANEEEVFFKTIAQGMIDQDSKIVVVSNNDQLSQAPKSSSMRDHEASPVQRRTGTFDQMRQKDQERMTCQTSKNVLQFPNKATRYRGNPIDNAQRRKLRRHKYTSSQGSNVAFYQNMPMSARIESSSKFVTLKDGLVKPQLKLTMQVHQITAVQRRSEVRSGPTQKYQYNGNEKESHQATLVSFQKTSTAVNELQCSSPSVLSRRTNTLSQVLGIRSRHQSPGDKAAQRQLLGGSYAGPRVNKESDRTYQSVMQNHAQNVVSNTNMTISTSITRAQAREFHVMRNRIKSQGAPRRRFVGQRQNLFNLMASGLRKQQPQGCKDLGPTSPQTATESLSSNQIDDNKSAVDTDRENPMNIEPLHTNRASLYHPSLCIEGLAASPEVQFSEEEQLKLASMSKEQARNDTLLTGDETTTQQNTARQFIACEDQLVDGANMNVNSSLVTTTHGEFAHKLSNNTPRFHPLNSMQLSSTASEMVSRSKTFDSHSTQKYSQQRMDLPHNMSVEQAVFMMSKAHRSEHLRKHEMYHRLYKKRGEARRLCRSHRNGETESVATTQQFQGGTLGGKLINKEDEMKNVKTSLEYSRSIVTEPKFKTLCAQKTLADYARQRKSMRLKISPYDQGLYIGKERVQRKEEYKKYETNKEYSLADTDEQYAMVRNHINRLKNRDQGQMLREMAQEQKETQQKLLEHVVSITHDPSSTHSEGPIRVEQLITPQGRSFNTLYQTQDLEALKDSKIKDNQTTEASLSQSLTFNRSLIQHQPKKLIQIVRVDTQVQQFENKESVQRSIEIAGGTIEGQRMSTKLLPHGTTESSQVPTKTNASLVLTNSQLEYLEQHQFQHQHEYQTAEPSRHQANNSHMQIISSASVDIVSNSQATFNKQANVRQSAVVQSESSQLPIESDEKQKNRQALSPQPMDRCSRLIQYTHAPHDSQTGERGFITVRQDYRVGEQSSSKNVHKATDKTNGKGTRSPQQNALVARSPVQPLRFHIQSQRPSEESKVGRLSPNQIVSNIKPIPSRQFEFDAPLMPTLLRLTSSTDGIMSQQEMINPAPRLIKQVIRKNSGSLNRDIKGTQQKKPTRTSSRLNIKTPLKSTPLKHTQQQQQQRSGKKKRTQAEKAEQQSISISGVKMFNAELSAMSGGATSQNQRPQNQVHQIAQQQQHHTIGVLRVNDENFASHVGTLVAASAERRSSFEQQLVATDNGVAASPLGVTTQHADQHSQGGLMVTMLQDVNSIASRQAIDYDDAISTEKKFVSTQDQRSSMLLNSRSAINKSLTARNGIPGMKNSRTQKHSDSQKLCNGGEDPLIDVSTGTQKLNQAGLVASRSPERNANLTPVIDYDRKL